MHGLQRLPALMFNNPESSLQQLNLQHYEIFNNEPLHDISNHIKNIYNELPRHMEKPFKPTMESIINTSFNGKEAKNSSNYREGLIIVTNWFIENNHDNKSIKFKYALDILQSLAEIQEILYLPDNKRSTSMLK